jgi:hypothetical protein
MSFTIVVNEGNYLAGSRLHPGVSSSRRPFFQPVDVSHPVIRRVIFDGRFGGNGMLIIQLPLANNNEFPIRPALAEN